MDTKEWWSKEGGDAYTKRNKVDWQARIPFWKMILDKTGARSVFEFGCNAGWNLSAIKRIYPDVAILGYDINKAAIQHANAAGLNTESDPQWLSFDGCKPFIDEAELVFTAGVLIHIPPEDLKQTMQDLIDKSLDYVLAIEYYAEEETEIEYQGEKGLLWKRPYRKLYQDMGLEPIAEGMAVGFDACTWSLLKK